MAVTGYFGNEEIRLDNAASEETLKQLISAVGVLTAKTQSAVKSQRDFAGELEDFYKELEKAAREGKNLATQSKNYGRSQQENTDATDDNTESLYENTEALEDQREQIYKEIREREKLASGIRSVQSGLTSLIGAVTNTVSNIAGMGNSMSSAAGSFRSLGPAGEVLSAGFEPVANAAERVFSEFQQISQVGANFSGDINGMIYAATAAGLQLEDYTQVVKNNGQSLALLGGSVDAGAKRLLQLGSAIRKSELGNELARLGFSTVDINEGFATYAGQLARTGRLEGMSNQQLILQTGQYLKNLDALSKLTGESKEALQQQQDALMADAQFRVMRRKLDADGQQELDAFIKSVPEAHRAGLKEILATGTATTEAGEAVMAYFGDTAREAQALHSSMRQTGTLTREQTVGLYDAYSAEAKRFADSPIGQTVGQFIPELNDFYIAASDVAGRTKTLAQIFAEAETSTKGAVEGLDPAIFKTFQENIAQTSNQMTQFLVNSEMFDKFRASFDNLIPVINDVAQGAFKVLETTIYGLAAAAGIAAVALTGLSITNALRRRRVGNIDDTLRDTRRSRRGPTVGQPPGSGTPPTTPTTPTRAPDAGDELAREARRRGRGLSPAEEQAVRDRVARQASGDVAEVAAKEVGEKVGKEVAETAGKSLLKKIPGFGLIAGLAFGADRAMGGDFAGAGLEVLSGLVGTVPGLGTAGSVAIDATLAARDMGAFESEESTTPTTPTTSPSQAETPTTPTTSPPPSPGSSGRGDGASEVEARKQAQETEKAKQDAKVQADQANVTTTPGVTSQNLDADQLTQLNTNIMELVSLMRENNKNTKRAADGLSGLSGDLFSGLGA